MAYKPTVLYWKLEDMPVGDGEAPHPADVGPAWIYQADGGEEPVQDGKWITRAAAQRIAADSGYDLQLDDGFDHTLASAIVRATNEAGEAHDDPPDDLLLSLLEGLGEGNSFLILERLAPERPPEFIQTMIEPNGEFVLEYREGPPEMHFSATLHSTRAVHDVMTKWALNLPGWRDKLTWTPVQY